MVILGLGSNIGDRLGYLRQATAQLTARLGPLSASRIFESAALVPPDAPASWSMPFLNMALAGETTLTPPQLLAEIKAIEKAVGRTPGTRWCPREIDIDILAMDDMVMNEQGVTVPHRDLVNRDFALLPLADVAPDWRYPAAGPYQNKTAQEIIEKKRFIFGQHLRETGLTIDG